MQPSHVLPVDEPDDLSDERRPRRQRRRGTTGRTWPAFWLPFASLVAVAFIGQRDLFDTPLQAWGDSAVNGLSVLRAEHLHQLVGNYSRVGFHHPGPAYMYLLGSGEIVFFHVLHVVPAPYNGQLLAVSVYVAAVAAAICLIVYRSTRSVAATVAAYLVVFSFAVNSVLFGADWFPFLYISSFLLMLVAAAAVAAGFTREWPFLLAGAALIAHGHASFLMFSSVTLVLVLVAWWTSHRGRVRAELGEHRIAAWATVAVAALASAPVVADFVLHFPGEWPKYFSFALHGEHEPRTMGQVLDFVKVSWTNSGLPVAWPVFVVAGVVGVALLLADRTPGRRRAFLLAYGVLALETLLYLYYVARGVDYLEPLAVYEYVGFFYRSVPAALLLLVLVQTCLFVGDRITPGSARTAATAVVAAVAVVLCATVLLRSDIGRAPAANQNVDQAADTFIRLDGDRGKIVVLQNDVGEVWPTTAALGLELSRRGVAWCTQGPNAVPIMFGADHICTPRQSARGMLVAITNLPLKGRDKPVWQDGAAAPRVAPGIISAYLPRR